MEEGEGGEEEEEEEEMLDLKRVTPPRIVSLLDN